MERTTLNTILAGGSIEYYDFDLRRKQLAMRIEVLENGTLSTHEVRFEGVSRLEFDTESKSTAADRLELTEMWIDAGPESSASEEWEIGISIFDMSHLRVRCSSLSVDGEPVR